jgi:outer membrane receptor protein involved in Fe transport
VNLELLPEAIKGEDIVVIGRPPTIDVGSSRVAISIDSEFTRRVAVNAPSSKGAATRSFESLAQVAPGTNSDTYGTSVNGTTSPENGFIIDGVSANDAAFGVLAAPLSAEFVKEVNVITAGYLPEYGRSVGGIMDVVTKSGSNEFHGSVFASVTPGAFEGPRAIIPREGSVISTNPKLSSIRDFGFELGGPIVKDKLWFFAGFSVALQRYQLTRQLNKLSFQQNADGTPVLDMDGNPIPITDAATGFQKTTVLPGTQRIYYADQQLMQYIGKLTWNINQDHNISVTVFGTPNSSGGNGTFPFGAQSGAAPTANLTGSYGALAGTVNQFTNEVVIKSSSAFSNKRYLVDATLGWVYNSLTSGAADGSTVADINKAGSLAYVPGVLWRKSSGGRHAITDFEQLPAAALAQCAPNGDMTLANIYCPVVTYNTGGPGFINTATQNRYQGRVLFTALLSALGQHVVKAGVDFELLNYTNTKGYSGGNYFREGRNGKTFQDYRRYGFLQAPDDPVNLTSFQTNSNSTTIGAYVQDSWSIMDRVTLNAGLRYDAQVVTGNDGRVGLSLPNQWSPRVGLIWDPTREGRAKISANFARFYQAVTLNMVDRSFPGETQFQKQRRAATCDPTDVKQARGVCDDPASLLTVGGAYDPNQKYIITGSDRVPVDPNIKPQSSDQWVVAGEYEIITDGRLGGAYTHQYMNYVVEDMSRDEAQTYFIGNPGYGMAKDFPQAVRNYDSFMVYFQKTFTNQWLATASYTVSYNRGNIAGLFRPETGQLDPNINSDFDLISLLPNRLGPLPGDRTHNIKLFGAKEFTLPGNVSINLGLGYSGRSGTPLNVLGSHPIYGASEVFILPRGSGGRTPWVHSIDTNITAGYRFSKTSTLTLGVNIFNLFNFQSATGYDQNFTLQDVLPIPNGSKSDLPTDKSPGKLLNSDGSPFSIADKNPNYGNPSSYQAPRQFRIEARVTF